ncbi:MAG: hypothetical protein FWD04_11300 [Conexibacteraceae bacterium]|nr:hypothetical protein [Conexibacteraceae bacterium]
MIELMTGGDVRADAARNEAARVEILRNDARRSLGENLEQADALIKAAYELAGGFAAARAREQDE